MRQAKTNRYLSLTVAAILVHFIVPYPLCAVAYFLIIMIWLKD